MKFPAEPLMGPTLFNLFVITECMFQYTLSTKQNKTQA